MIKKNKTIIIAEIGINHNGNLNLAKYLIDSAVKAKVDYVKFQFFNPSKLVSSLAKKSKYQLSKTNSKESLFSMLEKYTLSFKQISILNNYAKRKKIKFLCTPFDEESADKLILLNPDKIKISSGDITNLPLIDHISKSKIHLIISTGRSTIKEINEAIRVIKKNKCKYSILHCVSLYPAPFNLLNLNVITNLKKKYNCDIGFSDHSLGIEASLAAVALGANIIEKHITFSRKSKGPDHFSSLESKELKNFVSSIRNIEKALGDGKKKPSIIEKKDIKNARKSIISIKNISRGSTITIKDVAIKRPAIGLAPKFLNQVLGKKAKRNIKINTGINWSILSK